VRRGAVPMHHSAPQKHAATRSAGTLRGHNPEFLVGRARLPLRRTLRLQKGPAVGALKGGAGPQVGGRD
jgi:hypothetical protein